MRRCVRCSTELPDDAEFCPSCALDLRREADPGGATAGTIESDSAAPTVAAPARDPASPSSRSSSSAVHGRFLPGTQIGERYRIVALLGRGGMGEVYRADDLKLDQTVALKFLPEPLEHDARRLELLLAEVRLARQIAHPNVCRVYDVGEADGHPYISMEFVDGESLAGLLPRIGRLPRDKAIQIARQMCVGLAAAHEQGIIHRDLKPANVMIDGRGRARITDFGLAVIGGGTGGGVAGTPAYMAPEQRAGRAVTTKSDLYALGLVLYEVFTGRPAFPSRTLAELDRMQSEGPPQPPSALVEDMDPAAERAIQRCLASDPRDRPSSALQVAAALPGGDPLAAALAAGETPSPEMVAEAEVADVMSPPLALGLAALGVVLFLVAALLYGRDTLLAYVPLDKPPAAMVDRAREMIRTLGYTDRSSDHPWDRVSGYTVAKDVLDSIAHDNHSLHRWDVLRDPGRGIVSFWYRQSPAPIIPAGFSVGVTSPIPIVPGEMTVGLGMSGRLESFARTPPRIALDTVATRDPDWSLPFTLAGLDSTRFTPTAPRYQRFMTTERRVAWLGTRIEAPGETLRVEGGATQGKVALFVLLRPRDIARMSNPEKNLASMAKRLGVAQIAGLTIAAVLILGLVFLLLNKNRAHIDRRGARRVAMLVFTLLFIGTFLEVHGMVVMLSQLSRAIGNAVLVAAIVWVFYMALEPIVRRIWPEMLISWSRLVSGVTIRARDPLVGRSLLVGLVTGGLMALETPLENALLRVFGIAPRPELNDLSAILGTGHALSATAGAIVLGSFGSVFLTFILVLSRLMARHQRLAVALTLVIFTALSFAAFGIDPMPLPVRLGLTVIAIFANFLSILVLLRFGLLAAVVAYSTVTLASTAASPSLSEWYGQPLVIALLVMAVLAAWGYWGASGGRRWVPRESQVRAG